MKKFPKSWCVDVESEKDSPLYNKFMDWIKEKTDETPCGSFLYYDNFEPDKDDNFGVWDYGDVGSGITMVRLEEWNNHYFKNIND